MELVNQQLIKTTNLKRIYQIVRQQQLISRAGISQLTGLSKTTISALVDELIATKYLCDLGVGQSSKIGRKPNALQVNSAYNFVAVMSLHSKYLQAALIDTQGNICYSETIPFSSKNYVEHCQSALYQKILPNLHHGRLLGVCLVFPAMIDQQNKKMVSTVLDIRDDDDIIVRLREAIEEYPVAIFNDTACYAYAELTYSKLQESIFAFINVNKGVGAILLNQGQVFRGANGMTTQFGHFSVDRNGPVCTCGNHGCLECMIGETALSRRASECSMESIFASSDDVSFSVVARLAAAENPQALQLIHLLADDLAYALSNLISMLHPQLIVIGGTGVNLGTTFLEALSAKMSTVGFPNFMNDVTVKFTELSRISELQGAAAYYLDKHFSFDGDMDNKLFLE